MFFIMVSRCEIKVVVYHCTAFRQIDVYFGSYVPGVTGNSENLIRAKG